MIIHQLLEHGYLKKKIKIKEPYVIWCVMLELFEDTGDVDKGNG